MKRIIHILMLLPLLLAAGCARDMEPYTPASGLVLTVRCEDPDLTKAPETGTEDGETRFNENRIRSVDFFFYPGAVDFTSEAEAVYHKRINLEEDPVIHTGGRWEATFTLVLKRAEAEQIFPANNPEATVYAVVNYDGDLPSGASMADLATKPIITDFAATERDYIQDSFLMDGKTTVTYDESADINASGTIDVRRFAAKMTTSIFVADEVVLTHNNSVDDPDEVWKPVLHTMRIYLVDGAKNVTLGTQSSAANTAPKFFSYSAEEHRRPFVKNDDDGTEYIEHTTVGSGQNEKIYYNTYPMYSYPVAWSTGQPDYTQEKLPGQPYLKLELDWRRTEDNGYSYDRRKYYYKVILPENSLERNNWYHFNIDISILGSETEEGQTIIQPTCYVLDWQNKSVPIDKYAVISKARYLSVGTGDIKLNNLAECSIPFLSSHDVKIVEDSQTARRPYYGENPSEGYSDRYHAWVVEDKETGTYYLDYNGTDGAGKPISGPSDWLIEMPTSIEFNHPLVNEYTAKDFDYSPYTIEFDIVHKDLTPGVYPYDEYKKHITIIQYPAIYIDSCPNSDKDIRATSNASGKPYYHSENDPDKPWLNYPWGYVYIDGGRFIRTGNDNTEPYNKLTTDNNKKEYQWRTVWYTGGGRDIFRINVTVLPSNSDFVIGDPRIDGYDTTVPVLGYSFVNNGNADGDKVLENRPPSDWKYPYSNFHSAPVVDGDVNKPMSLTGESRPLRYYRPTEKSDRTINMLAPGYRFSTKLGGTEFGTIDEDHAKWRCAGYQEDGFPGGRWRLPTMSEIKFVAQLSANKVFEPMFKGDYWSANGVVNVNNGTVTSNDHTTAFLRCVYDAWYWGDEQWGETHDQFVWGDREP
ncbi:MAG: hypothetical protein VZR22_02455 [Candidatus Cryptobacteroides sp.]|nr:hypothetical protein [Candidatus Cryptobacteroides sp.]